MNFEAFKENLRVTAVEVLETSTSLLEDLEYGHRQTLADLDAISWALRRLMEFAGKEMEALPQKPVQAGPKAVPGIARKHLGPEQAAGREDPDRR